MLRFLERQQPREDLEGSILSTSPIRLLLLALPLAFFFVFVGDLLFALDISLAWNGPTNDA